MGRNNASKKSTDNPQKDRQYFIGFGGFDCQEMIWYAVFDASNSEGGSIRLKSLLSIDDTVGSDSFSNFLSGKRMWHKDKIVPFLNYSQDPKAYKEWLNFFNAKQMWEPSLTAFRAFNESVPESLTEEKHKRYYNAALQVKTYLEKILEHFEQNGETVQDKVQWIAAGMYTLAAFFVQNNTKWKTVHCYLPPLEYDPTGMDRGFVVTPDVVMHTSEEIQSSVSVSIPCCPTCGEEELLCVDDPMQNCYNMAAGSVRAYLWLSGICSVLFLLLLIVSCLSKALPRYSSWVESILQWLPTNFIAGFSNMEQLLDCLAAAFLFAAPCLLFLAARFRSWIESVKSCEEEKGYRWITFRCSGCGCRYKNKVSLNAVPKAEKTLSFGVLHTLLLVLITACSIWYSLFEIVKPAYYVSITFLAILLPAVIMKSLILRGLHMHLEQFYPDKGKAIFVREIRNAFREQIENSEDEEPEDEAEEDESEPPAV